MFATLYAANPDDCSLSPIREFLFAIPFVFVVTIVVVAIVLLPLRAKKQTLTAREKTFIGTGMLVFPVVIYLVLVVMEWSRTGKIAIDPTTIEITQCTGTEARTVLLPISETGAYYDRYRPSSRSSSMRNELVIIDLATRKTLARVSLEHGTDLAVLRRYAPFVLDAYCEAEPRERFCQSQVRVTVR